MKSTGFKHNNGAFNKYHLLSVLHKRKYNNTNHNKNYFSERRRSLNLISCPQSGEIPTKVTNSARKQLKKEQSYIYNTSIDTIINCFR